MADRKAHISPATQDTTAWNEGRLARQANKDGTACPYSREDSRYRSWKVGWEDCNSEYHESLIASYDDVTLTPDPNEHEYDENGMVKYDEE
jgi:hypothetical protein